jgi:hypothetical protein
MVPTATITAAIRVVSGIARIRPVAPTRVRTTSSAICPLVRTCRQGVAKTLTSIRVGSAAPA